MLILLPRPGEHLIILDQLSSQTHACKKKRKGKRKRKSMHGDSQLFENLTSTIEVSQVSLGSVTYCSKGRQHWNVQLSRMKQPFRV